MQWTLQLLSSTHTCQEIICDVANCQDADCAMQLWINQLWFIGLWLSKGSYYAASLSCIGGLWMCFHLNHIPQLQQRFKTYLMGCLMLATVASCSTIFCQLGLFSDDGIAGIFELELLRLYFSLHSGRVLLINLLCCSILLLNHLMISHHFRFRFHSLSTWISLIFLLILLLNYAQLGHSLKQEKISSLLLTFHVLAIALWIGTLVPLYMMCRLLKPKKLALEVRKLSLQLAIMLGTLIACGMSLAWLFIPSIDVFLNSAYGQAIMLKLMLVTVIFVLAGFNRIYLSRRLQHVHMVKIFQWVLILEFSIAITICFITAYMTAIVGLVRS